MRITKVGLIELLIATLFVVSLVWYTIIAIYETIYSIGVYLIFPVLAVGFIVGLISQLFKGRSLLRLVQVAMATSSLIYGGFIAEHYIREYKPSKDIQVPADFEGTVYLFLNDEPSPDVIPVDENGIGYLEWKGDFKVEVYHGSRSITEATYTSNSTQVRMFDADSMVQAIVPVWCFDVVKDAEYSTSGSDWTFRKCLTKSGIDSLMEQGLVDQHRIKFIPVAEPYRMTKDM